MEKHLTQKSVWTKEHPVIHPYSALDPLPVPEAIELDTDAAWALWQHSVANDMDERASVFANTMPADL